MNVFFNGEIMIWDKLNVFCCYSNFSRVLLPRQSSMIVNLPHSSDQNKTHDPFPANLVYISGFDDNVSTII